MIKKGTKLYSILNNKCPKCQEGDFFVSNNGYNLRSFGKMHDTCSLCDQKFEPETGFYFGAMYVSYGIGVAIFVTIWVACLVLNPEMHPAAIFGLVVLGLFLTFPVSFRLSRRIWINIFIKYEGNEIESSKQTN